jgi:hypothetical protein
MKSYIYSKIVSDLGVGWGGVELIRNKILNYYDGWDGMGWVKGNGKRKERKEKERPEDWKRKNRDCERVTAA